MSSDAPITVSAKQASENSGAMTLFGDWRDEQLRDALGLTIHIGRKERRAELDRVLAERVEPQLKKLAALELKLAELAGAVDVLSGKEAPPPPKFPAVRAWEEGCISYAGDIVSFAGSCWQALRDTAQAPGMADWTCVARAGRDGESFTVRGTYDPRDAYARLDVVAYNRASFAARKSAPGPCPGPDWQLLAKIGKRGERGLQGPAGERGAAAATIRSWEVDRTRYVATPIMADGTRGTPLELRGLFEQFPVGNKQWLSCRQRS